MNDLQVFTNKQFGQIRVVVLNGEPWLAGKDVAVSLGYTNPQKAVRDHVDEEDKTLNESFTVNGTPIVLINESGLYSLILSSKLPTAKQFKRWVTSDVIPSIRKTGGYIAGQENMTDTELMARALLVAQKTIDERNRQLRAKEEHIAILQEQAELAAPKVLFAEAVSASKGTILVRELAVLLKQNGVDIGQNRLYKFLRENGYLIKRSGSDWNMPTQYSMEHGWFEVKERTVVQPEGAPRLTKTPVVTTHGQEYFIDLFLKKQRANRRAGGEK